MWVSELSAFQKTENEKSESYQAILNEIQQAKHRLRDLEHKALKSGKELKVWQLEVADLEAERRGKERQLKLNKEEGSEELEVRALQREVREKEQELARVKMMISDKQEEVRRKGKG